MTIFGWDASHYDAPSIGNALAQGITFITHKAGGDSNDAELNDWWNGVKTIGQEECLLGAYWVLYPGSPSTKADAFIARLDSQCDGWRNRPFMLQVDCEKWGGDANTVPYKGDIQTFCERLIFRMPKLVSIVYGPEWVYGSSLAGLDFPLWASSYVNGSGGFESLYPGDGSSKWHSYSGQVPAVLQYTSSANIGGQTTCDANAYRGSLQELTNLVAPGWMEAPQMELTDKIGDETYPNRTVGDVLRDIEQLRDFLVNDVAGTASAGIKASAPVQSLVGLKAAIPTVAQIVSATVNALPPANIDVPALAAALVAAGVTGGATKEEVGTELRAVLGSLDNT